MPDLTLATSPCPRSAARGRRGKSAVSGNWHQPLWKLRVSTGFDYTLWVQTLCTDMSTGCKYRLLDSGVCGFILGVQTVREGILIGLIGQTMGEYRLLVGTDCKADWEYSRWVHIFDCEHRLCVNLSCCYRLSLSAACEYRLWVQNLSTNCWGVLKCCSCCTGLFRIYLSNASCIFQRSRNLFLLLLHTNKKTINVFEALD